MSSRTKKAYILLINSSNIETTGRVCKEIAQSLPNGAYERQFITTRFPVRPIMRLFFTTHLDANVTVLGNMNHDQAYAHSQLNKVADAFFFRKISIMYRICIAS